MNKFEKEEREDKYTYLFIFLCLIVMVVSIWFGTPTKIKKVKDIQSAACEMAEGEYETDDRILKFHLEKINKLCKS